MTIKEGGTSKSYSYNGSTQLGTIINNIEALSGKAELSADGVLEIEGVDSITGSIVSALGLEGTTQAGSKIESKNLKYTTGGAATLDSKLSEYGISPSGKVINIYTTDGTLQRSNVSLNNDATIGDLISTLNQYGLDGTLSSNGVLTITGGYITGSLATALGITSTTYSTVITDKTFVSKEITGNVSTTATMDTTLSKLGVNGTQYLTINSNGTVSGFNFNGNSTLADIRDAVQSTGGTFTIDDGYISISGVEVSGNLATNLGISKKNGSVTTDKDVTVTYEVKTLFTTTTLVTTQVIPGSSAQVVTQVITQTIITTIANATQPGKMVTITTVLLPLLMLRIRL